MGMDLNSLSPEELDALEQAISARKSGGGEQQGLAMLAEAVGDIGQRLAKLEAVVMDEIVGGITKLYDENTRFEGMKAFGGKFGGMLSPLSDKFKRTYGSDLMEKAYEYMESLKGEEGFDDEVGSSKMSELVKQIRDRLGEPEAVAVEVTEPVKSEEKPAAPAEEGDDAETASMYDEIARMKKRESRKRDSA